MMSNKVLRQVHFNEISPALARHHAARFLLPQLNVDTLATTDLALPSLVYHRATHTPQLYARLDDSELEMGWVLGAFGCSFEVECVGIATDNYGKFEDWDHDRVLNKNAIASNRALLLMRSTALLLQTLRSMVETILEIKDSKASTIGMRWRDLIENHFSERGNEAARQCDLITCWHSPYVTIESTQGTALYQRTLEEMDVQRLHRDTLYFLRRCEEHRGRYESVHNVENNATLSCESSMMFTAYSSCLRWSSINHEISRCLMLSNAIVEAEDNKQRGRLARPELAERFLILKISVGLEIARIRCAIADGYSLDHHNFTGFLPQSERGWYAQDGLMWIMHKIQHNHSFILHVLDWLAKLFTKQPQQRERLRLETVMHISELGTLWKIRQFLEFCHPIPLHLDESASRAAGSSMRPYWRDDFDSSMSLPGLGDHGQLLSMNGDLRGLLNSTTSELTRPLRARDMKKLQRWMLLARQKYREKLLHGGLEATEIEEIVSRVTPSESTEVAVEDATIAKTAGREPVSASQAHNDTQSPREPTIQVHEASKTRSLDAPTIRGECRDEFIFEGRDTGSVPDTTAPHRTERQAIGKTELQSHEEIISQPHAQPISQPLEEPTSRPLEQPAAKPHGEMDIAPPEEIERRSRQYRYSDSQSLENDEPLDDGGSEPSDRDTENYEARSCQNDHVMPRSDDLESIDADSAVSDTADVDDPDVETAPDLVEAAPVVSSTPNVASIAKTTIGLPPKFYSQIGHLWSTGERCGSKFEFEDLLKFCQRAMSPGQVTMDGTGGGSAVDVSFHWIGGGTARINFHKMHGKHARNNARKIVKTWGDALTIGLGWDKDSFHEI